MEIVEDLAGGDILNINKRAIIRKKYFSHI